MKPGEFIFNHIACMTFMLIITAPPVNAQHLSSIREGWAGNSINTVVFRKNAVVSSGTTQFTAYYDSAGYVELAQRNRYTNRWEFKQTKFRANVNDAHNSISIMIDGAGYFHMAWDHHSSKLRYCRSVEPFSLKMEEQEMTGLNELKITYPEFYKISNGDLLFLYRDGSSGKGNLVLNRYHTAGKKWERVQTNLIDGEGKRNAYWQACVDEHDVFHLSWVWRENPDVASNHDICYARSADAGKTWTKSGGGQYQMPVNAASAEYVINIPQYSELINQTSMTADSMGRPYIATYWKPAGTTVPQYQLLWFDGSKWQNEQVSNRITPFSLSGAGTKRIPMARPQVLINGNKIYYIFRDEERGNKVSLFFKLDNKWSVSDLTSYSVGQWEPSYDTELWKEGKLLNLFVQRTEQGDGEKTLAALPTNVGILECYLYLLERIL